jgi:hypothetical protein
MTVLGMDGEPLPDGDEPLQLNIPRAHRVRREPQKDIVTAMNHPRLYQRWFPGPSWNNWRIALKGAYAQPMTQEERAFFRTVADRDPPFKPVRELWFVVGRGGGKDSIASLITAHTASLFEPRGKLRPGERALCMCLACDRDQAKIVLDYTRSYFNEIPTLRAMVRRETTSGFELNNGVDIAISTNSFRSVRGKTLLLAILDEVAFYRSERSATPDEETYRAIGPGLARVPGSMLVGISTPYSKKGLLHRKFCEHYGKDGDVLVIRAPSVTFNPTINQVTIDAALLADPFAAKAEWLAEFRDDIAGWATRDLIESCVDRGVTVRPPIPNVRYHGFCDPSGGAGDSFTCGIAHAENGVGILDCLVEVRPPFNAELATAQITGVLHSYHCASTFGDRYAQEWVRQAFTRCGVSYHHSKDDRSAIYGNVLPLLNSGKVRLLDNKALIYQFASLERSSTPVGKEKIDHGVGGHDDLCNAAAGALLLAAGKNRWWDNPNLKRALGVGTPSNQSIPCISAVQYASDPFYRAGFFR